jgi:hypothetical protein
MKRFLFTLIILISKLAFCGPEKSVLTTIATYENQGDYHEVQGHAVVFEVNGKTMRAYTAAHLVQDQVKFDGNDFSFFVLTLNGQPAKVEKIFPGQDLAIVSFETATPNDPLIIDTTKQGEMVSCTGNRSGLVGPLATIETNAGQFTNERFLYVPVEQGDSGGPVLNAAGNLVGIISGKRGNISFFTPIQKAIP